MYLNSINNYRALAIIFIVSAHCYSIAELSLDTTLEKVFGNLTAGSTIHFVFISGFLFHHVFYVKNRMNTFLKTKVKRLLVPYLILSIFPILFKLYLEPAFWEDYLSIEFDSNVTRYSTSALLYYISGAQLVAYWYIPFAVLLFLMYRFHHRFISLPHRWQISITVLLFVIASLIHRPVGKLMVVQSLVYFTPIYLMGIICSINKEKIYAYFKGKEYLLLAASIILAIIPALMGHTDNYEKDPFVYEGIDLIIYQKALLCLFFMTWLYKYENFKSSFLSKLAATSFAIFFLHGYVLRFLGILKSNLDFHVQYPWLAYFVVLALLVVVSMLLALLLKRIFGKKSQYISGY